MLTASESAIITSFTISTVRKAFFTAVVWVVEGEAVGGHAHNNYQCGLQVAEGLAAEPTGLHPATSGLEIGVTNRIDFPSPASQLPTRDVRFANCSRTGIPRLRDLHGA